MLVFVLVLVFALVLVSALVLVLASVLVHPVSITRFPLTRFLPGAGLLRNPFFHR